jgi:predicted PurR-regulated permease PerM
LALIAGIILVFSAISLALSWVVADQLAQLQGRVPEIRKSIQNGFDDWLSRFPWLRSQLEGISPETLFGNFGEWALGGIQTGMAVLAGLVIIVAISIFTAVSSPRYFEGLLSLFPARRRPRAASVLHASAGSLRGWARAQLLDMSVVGVATALGLWIIGIDYWIVLGLVAGLLDIVPYVGPVTAAAATTLVTLGTEPDKIPWVLGLFLLIQQLEGNVLIPMIMREEADLPEVPLLVLIMLMSAWFGLLGALLAAPALAVGRTVYLMTYKAKMDRLGG